MKTLSAEIRDAILIRLATDHAKRMVRLAVLTGLSDWAAAQVGVGSWTAKLGQQPASEVERATLAFVELARAVRAEQADRIAALIGQQQRAEMGQVPS